MSPAGYDPEKETSRIFLTLQQQQQQKQTTVGPEETSVFSKTTTNSQNLVHKWNFVIKYITAFTAAATAETGLQLATIFNLYLHI